MSENTDMSENADISSAPTSITVERTIDAPAGSIFVVLSDPSRHLDLDGSGFMVSLAEGDPITEVGQVFTFNMNGPHMGGDYQTDNHVSQYATDSTIAWQTAPAGTEPPGWEWVWQLEPVDGGSTVVRQTYDWSAVTNPDLLGLFPLVSEDDLNDSLTRLASTV